MRVEQIMTRDVVSVAPDMPLREVAELLVANRISGVPVCSPNGAVLGIVSEVDILRKEEGVAPDLASPLAWLARQLDGEYGKVCARTAGEAMTAPALTVRTTQQVSEVARLMIDHRINRVPVVHDDRLVGIVSRADLVRAFIRSDAEVADEIREDVLGRVMLLDPAAFDVSVERGLVRVSGQVGTRDDAEIVERLVRRIPGVFELKADLRCDPRDSRRAPVRF